MKNLFITEEIGDGDIAVHEKGKDFPRIFMTNRFDTLKEWHLYKVENTEDYYNLLFNEEFNAGDPKFKEFCIVKNKRLVIKVAQNAIRLINSKNI